MLARLVLLFTIVPLVELALLFWIAERTSWWATIGLVVVTGVVGAALARHEGLRCLQAARHKLAQGQLPTDSLLDGPMILIAGTLLITPGVLTDLAGFTLLIPPVRRMVRRRLAGYFRARLIISQPQGTPWNDQRDEIIDVRVIDKKPDAPE